jgi:hypothetical protein
MNEGWQSGQVVEHLPSKQDALNSNPGTVKKKKKKWSEWISNDSCVIESW